MGIVIDEKVSEGRGVVKWSACVTIQVRIALRTKIFLFNRKEREINKKRLGLGDF